MAMFGQGINPNLGAIDYSAASRGAMQGSAALGQGIRSLGQDMGQGIQQYQQNKLMAGQATAEFETAFIQSDRLKKTITAPDAPPEVAKAFKKLQKDGAVGLRDAAVLSTYAKTFIIGEQREASAKMQMDKFKLDQEMLMVAQYNADSEWMRSLPQPASAEDLAYRRAQTKKLKAETNALGQPKVLDPLQAAQLNKLNEESAAKKESTATAKAKEEQAVLSTRAELAQTLRTVDEAISLSRQGLGKGVGGPISGLPIVRDIEAAIPFVGDARPKQLNSKYNTIKAALKLEKLAEMRKLSASGASGMGQLSDKEGASLESSVAELNTSLPEEVQRANLQKIRSHLIRLGTPSAPSGRVPSGWKIE